MALVEWSNQFSVGLPDIDNEHKKLIALLNSLHDAMKAGKGNDRLAPLLDETLQYTKEHFAREERLMQQYQYKDYSVHKKAHDNLVQQVNDYRTQILSNQSVLTTKVLQFLRDWLITHIGNMDKQYGPFLAEAMKKK